MRLRNDRGFTLTEVIVVMGIFMVILMVTSTTFNSVVSQMGQQYKSAETQIEGIIGLEVLRADVEQAGYGLPWTFQSTPANYSEPSLAGITSLAPLWPTGFDPDSFNDAPGNPPRSIQSATTTFNQDASGGSKYLVIKSLLAGTSDTVKKWTTVVYRGNTKVPADWGTDSSRQLSDDEKVIVLRTTYTNSVPQRQLGVVSPLATNPTPGTFYATYGTYSTLTLPHTDGDVFQVYGVDPNTTLRMPFNRADYFIQATSPVLPTCAPHTGTLYKAVANQDATASTKFTKIPLLDCVADMQVVYGLDTAGAGLINSHTTVSPGTPTGTTAQDIRDQLREIRVYILAQEGKKDASYTYPSETITVGESFDGGTTISGRVFNLKNLIGPEWKRYRWKLYTIVVRPKN